MNKNRFNSAFSTYLGAMVESIAEEVEEFAGLLASDEPQTGDEYEVDPFLQDQYAQQLIDALASFLASRKLHQMTTHHASWHYRQSIKAVTPQSSTTISQ